MIKKLILAAMVLCMVLVCGCGGRDVAKEYCTRLATGEQLDLSEARRIATKSECGKEGTLKHTYFCNAGTGTWWIDLEPYAEKELCPNPACVVNVATKKAEVNWRCMGLLP